MKIGQRKKWEDYETIPLDPGTISRVRLNIDGKERSNLFPWNGQFSPQLVEVLLETYSQREFLGPRSVFRKRDRFM